MPRAQASYGGTAADARTNTAQPEDWRDQPGALRELERRHVIGHKSPPSRDSTK